MKWILNTLFALGLLLLIATEFYPPVSKAFHQANSPIALEGQYSEETIDAFLDHGFGAENNRNGSVARKWKRDIRVRIYGDPDDEERQFLESNIKLLNTLTGSTRISLIKGAQEDANMQIHIIPRKQFIEVLPQYRGNQNQPTFFWCHWNRNSEIFKSTILVDQHLRPELKRNRLLRLLMRNIGLTELSLKDGLSVFTDPSRTDYSPLDTSLIQLLYENNILCGTFEKLARKQLAGAGTIALADKNERNTDEK